MSSTEFGNEHVDSHVSGLRKYICACGPLPLGWKSRKWECTLPRPLKETSWPKYLSFKLKTKWKCTLYCEIMPYNWSWCLMQNVGKIIKTTWARVLIYILDLKSEGQLVKQVSRTYLLAGHGTLLWRWSTLKENNWPEILVKNCYGWPYLYIKATLLCGWAQYWPSLNCECGWLKQWLIEHQLINYA